jgi:predicted ATPase
MAASALGEGQDRRLLAEMLSLPNDGRYPAVDLAPPERRQRTLDALLSGWEAVSRPQPLVMIFEDAHWADPTSLELFSRAVDRLGPSDANTKAPVVRSIGERGLPPRAFLRWRARCG